MDEILLRDPLNETSPAVPSNGPNCFSLLYKWIAEFLLLGTVAKIEGNVWRHVTMVARFLDLNHRSWQRRPFSLSNDGRKEWTTVFILSAIKYRKVIHTNCSLFSMSHLQDHGLLRSRNFVTMVTWQRDVTTSPLYWSGSQCHWSDSLSRQALFIFDRQ